MEIFDIIERCMTYMNVLLAKIQSQSFEVILQGQSNKAMQEKTGPRATAVQLGGREMINIIWEER